MRKTSFFIGLTLAVSTNVFATPTDSPCEAASAIKLLRDLALTPRSALRPGAEPLDNADYMGAENVSNLLAEYIRLTDTNARQLIEQNFVLLVQRTILGQARLNFNGDDLICSKIVRADGQKGFLLRKPEQYPKFAWTFFRKEGEPLAKPDESFFTEAPQADHPADLEVRTEAGEPISLWKM